MSDEKGKEDDPEVSAAAFEALERDFQEVLANLVGDKSLEKFRMEYEKLHRALKRSHEHEKKLIKKVRELNGEIVNNAAKVHTALKLSQEDQNTIATLRKEVEKAWKLVDVAHEKEVGVLCRALSTRLCSGSSSDYFTCNATSERSTQSEI